MSFVSPEFGLFCLLFLPAYWALASRPSWQRGLLILTGYGLYATWVPKFAVFLLVYSTAMWALGRRMQRVPDSRRPLWLGLWLVGSFLLSLKYYEFVRETFQKVLQDTGFDALLPVLDVVTPVGVSFFTFQAVTYLVMVGRRPTLARSWADVLLFLSFWPTLFAGPILRAEYFFAQLDECDPQLRVGLPKQPWLALYLIVLGLVQKVVLASCLSAQWVDPVYKFPEQFSSLALMAAMLGYSLQIFLDFAGYTSIVTGLALLLGFTLPVNFRQPYLARNLSDFWSRWHVSLSSFIRDYIYIPLGGNRRGFARTQFNVLVGMLISGLWHGANWTFVVWGLLHGLGVVVVNGVQRLGMPLWPRWAAQMMTFVFVSVAWVFFRADSVPQALQMLQGLFVNPKGFWADDIPQAWGLILIALCVGMLSPWAGDLERKATLQLARLRPWGGVLVLALVLCAVLFYGPEGVPNFIYYRF
jgi:D-alanyl-lipoteichoic acid acyltransferase DltB (MBOAT superfamily)